MMPGLLYKELILNRKNLAFLGGIVLLISLILFAVRWGSDSDIDGYAVFIPLLTVFVCMIIFYITGIFQTNIFATDETKKWAYFVSSTPLSYSGQVASKYWFCRILSLADMIWCYFLDIIASAAYGIDSGTGLIVGMILFFFQLFENAIEFPFMVRFGSKSGSAYKSAVLFIFIFILAVYGLFGDLSIFGSIDSVYEFIFTVLSGSAFGGKTLFVLSLCPYIVAFAYYFSCKFSCKLYLKGAECFDK